jgi:hypothetical protein
LDLRLRSEVDPLDEVQLVDLVVQGAVEGFGEIARLCGLRSILVVDDAAASVDARARDVLIVGVAALLEFSGLQRDEAFADSTLVHGGSLLAWLSQTLSGTSPL